MMRKLTLALIALGVALGVDHFQQGTDSAGWSPIKSAHAIVGRPASPVSVAGVARRTTRRVIVATSIYVATLPPSCTVVVVEGATLHLCGSTYYQPHGTQYVVVNVK